jgi:hypothetical protein
MAVVLLLALFWGVVLVPPALRAHEERQRAFLLSIGSTPDLSQLSQPLRPAVVRSLRVQRRRRIAGGLLMAMAVTLVVGLLPPFRVLLVVHLFLADSFIAYIGLLAHWANRTALPPVPVVETQPAQLGSERRRWWSGNAVPAPAVLSDLASLA